MSIKTQIIVYNERSVFAILVVYYFYYKALDIFFYIKKRGKRIPRLHMSFICFLSGRNMDSFFDSILIGAAFS